MSQVTIELEELKRLLKVEDAHKVTPNTEDVVKSIDSDKRLFTALTLRPKVPDAHGDIYDEDAVEKGCHNFIQVIAGYLLGYSVANTLHNNENKIKKYMKETFPSLFLD